MNHCFASDNTAGVHPAVIESVRAADRGTVPPYGKDAHTARVREKLRELFGGECAVFFVYNGTAANVLSIAACLGPGEGVICSDTAHVHVHEGGAPERFTGCKIIPVVSRHGKVACTDVEKAAGKEADEHEVRPRLVTVSQATEVGTVYTCDELAVLAAAARERGLLFHVDGARLANAAAALDASLPEMTARAGADIVSFGGTKNGLLCGEAVVVFDPSLAAGFPRLCKQGMQLHSKMRFIAAQFEAYLAGELWLENARHANEAARLLAGEISGIPRVEIVHPVESNAVFFSLPPEAAARLRERYLLYAWRENPPVLRAMTSFATRREDVEAFASTLRRLAGKT